MWAAPKYNKLYLICNYCTTDQLDSRVLCTNHIAGIDVVIVIVSGAQLDGAGRRHRGAGGEHGGAAAGLRRLLRDHDAK